MQTAVPALILVRSGPVTGAHVTSGPSIILNNFQGIVGLAAKRPLELMFDRCDPAGVAENNRRYLPLAGRIFPDPPADAARPPGHRDPQPSSTPPAASRARQELPQGKRVRHCWVVDCPEAPGRWPGVLLGWEQDPRGGWLGRVMMAVEGSQGMVTMTLWVRAEQLRPLASDDEAS